MRATRPGTLPLAVLDQGRDWQDVTGRVRPLTELDTSHLKNLIPFLGKHGESLRLKWVEYQCAMHYVEAPTVVAEIDGRPVHGRSVPLFSDNGGNLDGAFDEWLDHEMDKPFDQWLNERPLVKAIRQEIAGRGDVES